jgi:hypothetical protein
VSADIEFIDAQLAFYRGDRRKLEEFMSRHGLTAEQGAFVAAVMAGDVPQLDGRQHKRDSEAMLAFYEQAKRHYARLADALPRGLVEVNPHARRLLKLWRDPDAAICKMISKKHRIAPESVRRTITRALKRRAKRTR